MDVSDNLCKASAWIDKTDDILHSNFVSLEECKNQCEYLNFDAPTCGHIDYFSNEFCIIYEKSIKCDFEGSNGLSAKKLQRIHGFPVIFYF